MQKYADYIKQIEIDALWSGRKHIIWDLDRQVNILSGVNGVGKSTILNKVVKGLSSGGDFPSHLLKGVHLKVEPEDARLIRFDIIRSFDRPIINSDAVTKMGLTLATEMDWQIFLLQRKYLDYQVNIGNRIIATLQSGEPDAAEKAQALSQSKKDFQDIMDSLFAETGKKIIRTENEINLIVNIVPWNTQEVYDRLGLEEQYMELLGVKVPMNTIPITPGRNLAMILEVAAMNNRHRKFGYNAAQELARRVDLRAEGKS